MCRLIRGSTTASLNGTTTTSQPERERERERERKRLWGFNRPCMTTLTVFDPAPLLLSFSPSLLLSFSLSLSLSFLVINRPAIGSCLLKAAALFAVVHWGRFYSRRCNPLTSLSLSFIFFPTFSVSSPLKQLTASVVAPSWRPLATQKTVLPLVVVVVVDVVCYVLQSAHQPSAICFQPMPMKPFMLELPVSIQVIYYKR